MTSDPAPKSPDLVTMAKDATEVLVNQEVQLLQLIQAEVAVLGQMLGAGEKARKPETTEAEIEAGFDNMPL